jgi:hypothetical protein
MNVIPVSGATTLPVARQRQAGDGGQLRFQAQKKLDAPDTVVGSAFSNQRVVVSLTDPVASLIERLDEMMTVVGEVYSGNEAFTATLDMTLPKGGLPAARSNGSLDASVSAQVEHAFNLKTSGLMVIGSEARNAANGKLMATARAVFNAVDPASLKEANLRTVPVSPLAGVPQEDFVSQRAAKWNDGVPKFYRELAKRLGARDDKVVHEDLSKADTSNRRLVNSNVYVTSQMLNKKHTGHGGITAGMALKDVNLLAKQYSGMEKLRLSAFSASYLEKYLETDALQFDTTVDHVDEKGNMYLSSRISKLDTKARTVRGPIILVHARLAPDGWGFRKPQALDPASLTPEERQRQQDAIAWGKLHP